MSRAEWDFTGSTALVSGGAQGIGEAIVRKFAAAGAHVVFSDLQEEAGGELEGELRDGGADVRFHLSDATDEAQVSELVSAALAITGRLECAVNNVGGIAHDAGDEASLDLHDIALSAWQASLDLNLTSCFLGMKHQIPPMIAAGGGSIVNLTSLAALRHSPGSSLAYAAAKAGVVKLTEYAAVRYGSAGIRVNVLAPGFTLTSAIMKAYPDPEQRKHRARNIPMGRMIEADELANTCLWLCSDAAGAITGHTVPVDGGRAAS